MGPDEDGDRSLGRRLQEPPRISAARKAQVQRFLEQQDWAALRDILAEWTPDVAELLQELDKNARVLLFRGLPRGVSSDVFGRLDPDVQERLLSDLTDQESRQLLATLPPDDRTALLEELPAEVTRRLLDLLGPDDLREARWLLGYPDESVGRLMTPDYVSVRPDWTVAESLDHVRRVGRDRETIHRIYVTDAAGKLIDDLPLRRFILAAPEARVETLGDRMFSALSPYDDREQGVEAFRRLDAFVLPVVDRDGVLLGIVTLDDVIDVAQEEATEDIQRTAGLAPLGVSYHDASVVTLYRRRVGWLAALVVVYVIAARLLAGFEATLSGAIALAFFIPLVIGSAGNAGSQSAMLLVRAIATGDVDKGRWRAALKKEILVSLLLGVSLAVLGGSLGLFQAGAKVAGVVAISILILVVLAIIVGTMLPLLLSRFRLDPAMASSPLITTLTDSAGLLVYLGVATWFLRVAR